jgi:hypothetical protein
MWDVIRPRLLVLTTATGDGTPAPGVRPPPAERRSMGSDPAPQDAQAFIAALDEVDLSRFRVVGTYTRYDEAVRNALQDARQKILGGFEPPNHGRAIKPKQAVECAMKP